MTFEDRVRALGPLGFSPRQTRFLATVALHGGWCLRRQYASFAGLEYGKHVRDFLDALVTRDLARRITYKRNRGFIYHVHAKTLYKAIEQEDNRNRRTVAPALIARKLMLLDLVIATPDAEWYATEDDKVTLFTTRFEISVSELPQRLYAGATAQTPPTVRAFVHKLPIYLVGNPVTPHFVTLADGVGESWCEAFLRDHAPLLRRLSDWTLVATGPQQTSDFTGSKRAFHRFCGHIDAMQPGLDLTALRWYCETRQAVEANCFDRLSVAAIARFRDLRRRLSSPRVDALYDEWLTSGVSALDRYDPAKTAKPFAGARFEARPLPYRYTQFGDLPGIC